MLTSLVVLFASISFLVNAGIAITALRVLINPKTSDAVRLPALKLVTFAQRFLAWIFVFGLFGLAMKGGILPSISIPTHWESSPVTRSKASSGWDDSKPTEPDATHTAGNHFLQMPEPSLQRQKSLHRWLHRRQNGVHAITLEAEA